VSGKFEKGMKVKVARTGRLVSLSRPQQMFAQSRATVQEGFAGDVIGLTSRCLVPPLLLLLLLSDFSLQLHVQDNMPAMQ
jgi:hypothetical protein